MNQLEQQQFEAALDVPVEQFPALPVEAHVSKAREVYQAIRPALTSIGWIVGLLKPKLKRGIDVLIVLLDNLFNAL